jgi:predicted PurR-regulated permease PerM
LSPIVAWMARLRIYRWVSAAILLILLVIGLAALTYELGAEGASAVTRLPQSIDKLSKSLKEISTGAGFVQSIRKSVEELEKAAAEATGSKEAKDQAARKPPVKIEQPTYDFHHFLWMGSTNAFQWMGQIVLNIFLVYFLLSSGDLFKRKIVKIAGNTFAAKKITVRILDEINSQIQRFLLAQLLISVIVWLLSWAAFGIIGLENALVWAILAGALHLVPYLGAVLVTVGAGLVGFFQFGTFKMALLVMGSSTAIAIIAGMIILPWLTSRAIRMNPGAVFITLLLWSWIWGVWGLLLGTPITVAFKTVCDHIEGLESVGELLGE